MYCTGCIEQTLVRLFETFCAPFCQWWWSFRLEMNFYTHGLKVVILSSARSCVFRLIFGSIDVANNERSAVFLHRLIHWPNHKRADYWRVLCWRDIERIIDEFERKMRRSFSMHIPRFTRLEKKSPEHDSNPRLVGLRFVCRVVFARISLTFSFPTAWALPIIMQDLRHGKGAYGGDWKGLGERMPSPMHLLSHLAPWTSNNRRYQIYTQRS